MADAATRQGSINGTKFRLAAWADPTDRYQRRYLPLETQGGVVGTDGQALGLLPDVRTWAIRSWSGGEGEDVWDPELKSYRESDGLRPVSLGSGLELGWETSTPSASSEARRFGYGLGSLWTLLDGDARPWTGSAWDTAVSTGAGASAATSASDGDDTYMYSGHADGSIRRWKTGVAETHFAGGTFAYSPVVRSFGGFLYALDGDDLYEIDKSTPDTRTQVADVQGSSAEYLATTWSYNRITLSDKGPVWLQRLDNGQTFIWEYNQALDVQDRIGKLPVDFTFPYSIFYAQGFVFVGFRYGADHAEEGDAYIYFQRGAQRGLAGPFRTDDSASQPVLIAGMIGDDLVVVFDGGVWAYNVTDGGIARVAELATAQVPSEAVTWGKDVFVAGDSNATDRINSTRYQAAGELSTGRYDFEYPGLRKTLLDVTVVTDPLAAATSVTMEVSVDGGTPVALSGTHDADGDRRFVWSAPSGTTLEGYEFELVPHGATSDSSVSPVIRQLFASVSGAAHRIEWVLTIDCSDMSHEEIDALNALPGSGVVTFEDPWQNRESDSPDSFAVTVKEVVTPEVRDGATPDEVTGRVRMVSRDLVSGVGGS